MSIYQLDDNEAVIMQDHNVTVGSANVTLILTNHNIIQVSKVFLRGYNKADKYPLLELKELNGKPNVRVGKAQNGKTQLELYFYGYEKFYSFLGLRTERKWASAIEKAYKAAVGERIKASLESNKGKGIWGSLKETIETARSVIAHPERVPKIRTMKCPYCGAELSGEKGKEVKCSYCESVVIMK